MAFASLKLHPTLLEGVDALGFAEPTPVQTESIPYALDGRDLLACAETGSGKTAAFLLPILHRIVDLPRGKTRALVIAPTRELALQIVEEARALARFSDVTAAAVFGGVKIGPQEKAFRKGVDILVATPGRLLDHFQYDYATLSDLEYLVLDEADRMLDMGFLPDVRRILRHIPRPEQSFFFSATMPPEIEQLTREILDRPAKVALQRKAAPAAGVTQAAYPVPVARKSSLLIALLKGGGMEEALVFTRTKHRADRLTKLLEASGISAERIHGNRSQAQRTKALEGFKRGEFQVLVATDIAARGIDVEALGHVVNYDVPNMSEDYIHRVGRTARAELTGEAFTLVSPDESRDFGQIERAVGSRIPRVRLEGFDYDGEPDAPLEIPRGERIRAIQAKRREDRARAKAKAERKEANREAQEASGSTGRSSRNGSGSRSRGTGGGPAPAQDEGEQRREGTGKSQGQEGGGSGRRRRRRRRR